ncbi:MAG: hypothetical protein KME64_04565 [Scytonematopsis contorta HA4267-MV1]|jgi:hypothetical protein|nr:hypothetical protein [Scytonematopsis contorta HA4267-MV1]
MKNWIHPQEKALPNSKSAPLQNASTPGSFTIQPQIDPSPSQIQDTAEKLGHNFAKISIFANNTQLLPPSIQPKLNIAAENIQPQVQRPNKLVQLSTKATIQRKFKLLQPDNEDCYLYGWVDNDTEQPQGEYQYLGSYTGLGGKNQADLLMNSSKQLFYVTNMFGKSQPKPWTPDSVSMVDQDILKHAQANIAARMTKREPTPSGEIGKMNFRFSAAEGALWYVNSIPNWFKPQEHQNVNLIKTDVSTIRARIAERKVDLLEVARLYEESYEPDKYFYMRRPASVTGQDSKPQDKRSKYVFAGKSLALKDINSSNAKELETAASNLEKTVPLLTVQEVEFTAEAKGKERGEGQVASMGGMNAAAYALALNAPGCGSTDWEWLHIRGARLGGATSAVNLVAGTNTANSHMIPYEHGILELSKLADSNHPLFARWTVEAKGRLGLKINIAWSAPKGLYKNDKFVLPKSQGSSSFSPLNGQIFDRVQRDAAWNPGILETLKPPVTSSEQSDNNSKMEIDNSM